jgi:ATP-dependent Clp protease ATP-binding subunit ClpC
MFDRYTESARQAVFYARYEASKHGRGEIEIEHLLLGVLSADPPLAFHLLHSQSKIASIRERVASYRPREKETSTSNTSKDLPLSRECKRALTYAAKECQQLKRPHIGTELLLLGIACEETCFAAASLREQGITPLRLREEVIRSPAQNPPPVEPQQVNIVVPPSPLIGREREVEDALRILLRRHKNNVALSGEPGVGKTAIAERLVQLFGDSEVSSPVEARPIMSIDAALLRGSECRPGTILCLEGLFDLATSKIASLVEPHLVRGAIQCIATGTPAGLVRTKEIAPALLRHFEVVNVLLPTEEDAAKILSGLKEKYEEHHGVIFTEEAIRVAIRASGIFLPHRNLPDRALDLMDEAGALVRLRGGDTTVTRKEIEEVIAARVGMPVEAVRRVLQRGRP